MTLAPALLVLVRAAVADVQEEAGFPSMAAQTRDGGADDMPFMQAAIAAAERVLREVPAHG